MRLLDKFILHTGRQPVDWTSEDIQQYLSYVKTHVTAVTMLKEYNGMRARSNVQRSASHMPTEVFNADQH